MSITPMTTAVVLVVFSSRLRKIQLGRIGSAARRSSQAKMIKSTPPAVRTAMLGTDVQRQRTPPSSRPRITSDVPTASSAAPAKSIRCVLRSTASENLRISVQAATAPSGTLTKKIHRQLRKSTNNPPRVGPTTDDIAQTLAT